MRIDGLITRKLVLGVIIAIIVAGALVGLSGLNQVSTTNYEPNAGAEYGVVSNGLGVQTGLPQDSTIPIHGSGSAVVSTTMAQMVTSATTVAPSTTVVESNPGSGQFSSSQAQQPKENNSGFVEFFSNVTLQVASPKSALDQASSLAYSYGGYVAYSSLNNYSAAAVLRVPASNYAIALTQLESIGNLTGLQSTSNDVRVQYTDLNATLQSLLAEQGSLLKLVNQSTMLNETLIVENQLQQVDAQINSIQSQILQTRLLIAYSTITATFYKTETAPTLSLKLSATPQNGLSALAVTFTAVLNGGAPPYIVNYNFGDGNSYEGQSLIHTFFKPGTYNVTATVTDSSGNAREAWIMIHVTSPPSKPALSSFLGFVGGLFFSVLEGIVEVAVIVIPIALVATAVVFPFWSRMHSKKSASQESK